MELLGELALHLVGPLRRQSGRAHHERAPHEASCLELLQDEACLNGLSEADLVCQQVAHVVVGERAVKGVQLVRQRDHVAREGRQRTAGHLVLDARELHNEAQIVLVIAYRPRNGPKHVFGGTVGLSRRGIHHAVGPYAPEYRALDDAHGALRR